MSTQKSQKIRIKLRSFKAKPLDQAVKEIIAAVKRAGARIQGASPLPVRTRKITLLASPHVDKRSRTHLKLSRLKRVLDIYDVTSEAANALVATPVGPDVHVEIQTGEE